MSRFTSRKERTPAYETAVRALRDLAASDGGWDAVERAFAEAIAGHSSAAALSSSGAPSPTTLPSWGMATIPAFWGHM